MRLQRHDTSMARPRVFVQVGRREIAGVSRRSDGRFYIIDPATSKRRHFRDVLEAKAAYDAAQARPRNDWEDPVSAVGSLRQELAQQAPAALSEVAELLLKPVPDNQPVAAGCRVVPAQVDAASPTAVGLTLSRVLSAWRELRASASTAGNKHYRATTRRLAQFANVIGDVATGRLTPACFRRWGDYLRQTGRSRPPKWSNDSHATVAMVLCKVKREAPDWPWPLGLADWLSSTEHKPYTPAAGNRQPKFAEVFHRLRAEADKWAMMDVAAGDGTRQAGRGQRRQTDSQRYIGKQLRAALLLSLNCVLDPVNFSRIKGEHILLKKEGYSARRLGNDAVKVSRRAPDTLDRVGRPGWKMWGNYR
jgi:hypothetical protein